jgi:hypothetical protein
VLLCKTIISISFLDKQGRTTREDTQVSFRLYLTSGFPSWARFC